MGAWSEKRPNSRCNPPPTHLMKDNAENTRWVVGIRSSLGEVGWRWWDVLLGWVGCCWATGINDFPLGAATHTPPQTFIIRPHLHRRGSLGWCRCSLCFLRRHRSLQFLLQRCLFKVSDRPVQLSRHRVGILESLDGVFSTEHLVRRLHELLDRDLDAAYEVAGSEERGRKRDSVARQRRRRTHGLTPRSSRPSPRASR